jgi:hypothetical protein
MLGLKLDGHSVVSPGVTRRSGGLARAAAGSACAEGEAAPSAAAVAQRPARGWVCEVQYVGWLVKAAPAPADGASFNDVKGDEFDRSMSAYPFKVTMGAGSVVPGFEEAIMSMHVGERAEFWLRCTCRPASLSLSLLRRFSRDRPLPRACACCLFFFLSRRTRLTLPMHCASCLRSRQGLRREGNRERALQLGPALRD